MDFYAALKACYREGISPFALYSQMCDLCKGDLKLYEKSRILYGVYSNRDIFKEISLCKEALTAALLAETARSSAISLIISPSVLTACAAPEGT